MEGVQVSYQEAEYTQKVFLNFYFFKQLKVINVWL